MSRSSRFGGWLLQIVRNRARNLMRHHDVRRADPLDEHTLAGGPSPAVEIEQHEVRERLRAALAVLSEIQREIVLLHDLEGWTHGEIAERLELPTGTVRSHLHHARRRLREILGNLESER
ncbi:MAG: RNA polymerase sigma factor [Gemmatimonadales bacterium]